METAAIRVDRDPAKEEAGDWDLGVHQPLPMDHD